MLLLLLIGGGAILLAINTDEETQVPVPTTTAAAIGNFTRPGTQLEFGEKALVLVKLEGVEGILGVTATGIKKGDPAELAPLKLGDTAAGKTPYYVSFVLTNESDTDLPFAFTGALGGLLGDGNRAERSAIGNFAPCRIGFASKEFARTKGASLTSCTLTFAGGSATVVAATYAAATDARIDYSRDPIIWK